MKPTRRAFVGAAVAGVPAVALAGFSRRTQAPAAEGEQPMLAYLVADVKKNIALARVPGRRRGQAFRALGANIEALGVLGAARLKAIESSARQRLNDEGVGVVAQEVHDKWPELVAMTRRDYDVTLPALDLATATDAMEKVRGHGLPRFPLLRRFCENLGDHFEQEGQGHLVTVRQDLDPLNCPGCFWPGDKEPNPCYLLGLGIAAIAFAMIIQPEVDAILGPVEGILVMVYALFCQW
jgi:hypothetical protein